MRPIDADALINRIVFHSDLPFDQKEAFEDEINAEPPAQREIIRCKNCKHYHRAKCDLNGNGWNPEALQFCGKENR